MGAFFLLGSELPENSPILEHLRIASWTLPSEASFGSGGEGGRSHTTLVSEALTLLVGYPRCLVLIMDDSRQLTP